MRALDLVVVAACGVAADPDDVVEDPPEDPPPPPARYASCAAALAAGHTANAVYTLSLSAVESFDAYCNMTDHGGGWTLAIKADGSRATFVYDSPEWTSPTPLGPDHPDHDTVEAKLASYARLAANELLIETGDGTLVLAIGQGRTLHEMIAPDQTIDLAMNPYAWSEVLPSSSVPTCARESGLDVDDNGYKARIGALARNFGDRSCDDNASHTIGVGLAYDDTCPLGPTSPRSAGHVAEGCMIDDPFVYVYVR
jgi:hypothetical protein